MRAFKAQSGSCMDFYMTEAQAGTKLVKSIPWEWEKNILTFLNTEN